jgi:HD-like signal output (HDOD) protein
MSGDAQVLESLRRSLRVFQNSWSVHLSDSIEGAMAALADHEVEAVVCDSKASGEALEPFLEHVHERWPRIVRALLAGPELPPEVVQRLGRLVHQTLKKPVLPAQLFDLIERAVLVLSTVRSDRLKVVISKLGSLPALPATYAKLNALTRNPNVSLDELAGVVERDPAVTANVLKIINSAYFGLPRRVSSVRETVRLLGIEPLKNIVLTVELFEGIGAGRQAKRLQQDALARACGMRELLGRTPHAEAAFAAGILADVGQLLIAARLPIDMAAIEKAQGLSVLEAERERLGCSHAEIGGALLSLWNMPAAVVEAVTLHHTPPEAAATANVPTALALVAAIEEESKADVVARPDLLSTIETLMRCFPLANLTAVRRQLTPKNEAQAA